MRRMAILLVALPLLALSLPPPFSMAQAYRGLTRGAIEKALYGYPLVRLATEGDGHGGKLTVAEGAKAGDPPFMVFGVWDGTRHVRIASGWDADVTLLGPGQLAIRFNVGQPNAYRILYRWNGKALVASRPEEGSSPPDLFTVTPEPSTASVGVPVTLVTRNAPGPVTFRCGCAGGRVVASAFVAEVPGTYTITARSGFWQTTAKVTVTAGTGSSSTPPPTGTVNPGGTLQATSPASNPGMTVTTPSVGVGDVLEATLPVAADDVFWWLTNAATGMEYPLFGSSSSTFDAALPPVIPPGSYTLAAQVNASGEAPLTFTAPITVTGLPSPPFSGTVVADGAFCHR